MTVTANLTWHAAHVSRQDRQLRNGHGSCVLWFTGLSGSGKSTLAFAVERELFARGKQAYALDGDNIRHGLNRDLGFSEADRRENIRRIGEVAKLFADAGVIVAAAFISPSAEDRAMVRRLFAPGDFIEVHVACPLDECERRDPKGLYRRARAGELPGFTGIAAPYEAPEAPELTLRTDRLSVGESVSAVLGYLMQHGFL